MSAPSNRMAPPSLARSPAIWAIRVVFPAPLGPMSACTSPGFTSSVTSSVATTPPKRLDTFFSSSILLPREPSGDPLWREQHDREQHDTDAQARVLLIIRKRGREPFDAVVGDQVLEAEQRRGADHPAPQPPDAAQDHHHHERPRLRPVQHARVDVLAVTREQHAGEAAGGARDDEARELVAVYREPDRLGARLVLPDRLDHAPETRVRDAVQAVDAGRQQNEHRVVKSEVAAEIDAEAGRGALAQAQALVAPVGLHRVDQEI